MLICISDILCEYTYIQGVKVSLVLFKIAFVGMQKSQGELRKLVHFLPAMREFCDDENINGVEFKPNVFALVIWMEVENGTINWHK